MMDGHHAAQFRRFQLVEKSGHLGRARQVIKFESRRARRAHPFDHRQDRRDANATGDEDILRRRHQFEIITRRRDHDLVTDFRVFNQADRTTAPALFALHRDAIAIALLGIIAERIFADLAVRHAQRNMGARHERHELAAIGLFQLEIFNAIGGRRLFGDPQGLLQLIARHQHSPKPIPHT